MLLGSRYCEAHNASGSFPFWQSWPGKIQTPMIQALLITEFSEDAKSRAPKIWASNIFPWCRLQSPKVDPPEGSVIYSIGVLEPRIGGSTFCNLRGRVGMVRAHTRRGAYIIVSSRWYLGSLKGQLGGCGRVGPFYFHLVGCCPGYIVREVCGCVLCRRFNQCPLRT